MSKFLKSKSRNSRLGSFSLTKLFPNIITMSAICFGLTSIRYALDNKWEVAVTLIIIAGFLDVVDGRLARYLKATSNFGAYLDSLADFIDFGVAPAVVIYLWNLRHIEIKGVGWAIVLFFSVCMAVRLARFNSDLDEENRPAWKDMFFKGVPAPAGAYLAMMPMMLNFRFNCHFNGYFIAVYMVLVALLLVSTIPTFSVKKVSISREYVPLFFVCFGLVIAMLMIEPWVMLPVIGFAYLGLIPFSVSNYKKYLFSNNSNK